MLGPTYTSLEELVDRAQAGDEKAFAVLFNHYSPGICGYLAGFVRNTEDRDELAQDTFFKAWEKLSQLRKASQFKPWLYQIATRLAYDYRRRQRGFWLLPLKDGDDLENPTRFEEYVAEEELVKLALKQVPWKYRTCLLLQVEGRLTQDEIAVAVGISKKSVGVYISYGREHFRQAYWRLTKEGRRPE